MHLLAVRGEFPYTVTASYSITLAHPTPTDQPVLLTAWVAQNTKNKAVVEGTLEAGGRVTATCTGTFVAVSEGHVAHGRW